MYEHSLTLANPIYDMGNDDFKANLRSHLLFSDGAVGLLIMPESMVKTEKDKYMEIIDINTGFHLGDAIQMKKGRFLVADNIKDVMPKLVSNNSILPILKNNNLSVKQVDEWSIHQGGIPVLQKFMDKDILGLSKKQITESLELFKKYGNFSTPSCFFVLNSFFNKTINKGQYGAIVSFGAGYYYGTILYKNHCSIYS